MPRKPAAVTPTGTRAVVYLRRSRDDGPGSVPVQDEACHAYAASHDLTVIAIEQDMESAYADGSENRAGYQRVIELCRGGAVEHVIVWQLSRFGRDAAESLARMRELKRLGVVLHSTMEDLTNKLLAGLLAVLAEDESDRLSARVRPRKRQLAAQGRFQGSRPPWGTVAEDGALRPGPQFESVRLCYELAAEGMGVVRVAAEVSRRLLLDPPLGFALVSAILDNPAYIGILRGQLPDGYGETAASWPAMIDPALFAHVQALRSSHRRDRGGRIQERFWLRGLVRCAVCGGPCHLSIARWAGSHTNHSYIRCNRNCRGVSYRANRLQDEVADALAWLVLPADAAPLLATEFALWNEQMRSSVERAPLEAERRHLLARRERIETLLIDGDLDPARARPRLAEAEAAINQIDLRLARLPRAVLLDVESLVRDLTATDWLEGRYTQPREFTAAVRRFITRVELAAPPGDPVIVWSAFAQAVRAWRDSVGIPWDG